MKISAPLSPYIDATTPTNSVWYQKGRLLNCSKNMCNLSCGVLGVFGSEFSDDPQIQEKLHMFFEQFNNLPFWYQTLFVGVVASIYGLKGADIFKKK